MSQLPQDELVLLRTELLDLRERVAKLERQVALGRTEPAPSTVVPVTVNYVQPESPEPRQTSIISASVQAPEPVVSTTPSGRGSASQYSDDFRRKVARDVGAYLRRCVEGRNPARRVGGSLVCRPECTC